MFDLTTYVKKWQIRQLKTVFSTLDTLWRLSFETQIFETETETFSETQILRHISHISMLRRARNSVLPTKLAFLVNKSLKNRTALPPLCKPFNKERHYC